MRRRLLFLRRLVTARQRFVVDGDLQRRRLLDRRLGFGGWEPLGGFGGGDRCVIEGHLKRRLFRGLFDGDRRGRRRRPQGLCVKLTQQLVNRGAFDLWLVVLTVVNVVLFLGAGVLGVKMRGSVTNPKRPVAKLPPGLPAGVTYAGR